MMDNKRKILILGMFFLFGILMVNFVGAEMLVSDVGVQYDSDIIGYFNNQSFVRVLVRLEDNSNLPASNIEQRDVWFKSQVDGVLRDFSKGEFEVDYNLTTGFSGYVSKEGFNRLINDSRIRKVSLSPLDSGAGVYGNGTNQNPEEQNSDLKEDFDWLSISLIVILIFIIVFLIMRSIKGKKYIK